VVSLIMERALDARASDIHIEPFESRLIVRFRVDGVMQRWNHRRVGCLRR
jgi:general secretion pathway protein E